MFCQRRCLMSFISLVMEVLLLMTKYYLIVLALALKEDIWLVPKRRRLILNLIFQELSFVGNSGICRLLDLHRCA
jgi:hypothetical protein